MAGWQSYRWHRQMAVRVILFTLLAGTAASTIHAQWTMQDSHSKAAFRGIHYVGHGVAWASGTQGTVLRTVDGGSHWQSCTIPSGAENLDFRGVQALNKRAAIVMSSGKGNLSRLYKTVDGCRTWKLLFANPDEDGFWDSLLYDKKRRRLFVLGDPVKGNFVLYSIGVNGGSLSPYKKAHSLKAAPGESAFAASNSLLNAFGTGKLAFVTGGSHPEIVLLEGFDKIATGNVGEWSRHPLPFATGESSGAFSIASRPSRQGNRDAVHFVVVGGDYQKPKQREQTGAFSSEGGTVFLSAETSPHGYRSAVAYDAKHKAWIAVGSSGTDISRDDGRTWSQFPPVPKGELDSNRDWNALSLPFVVGPHGRIGKLDARALDGIVKLGQHRQ